jgi:glycosyltransferase involved in cell wall biosynthesis
MSKRLFIHAPNIHQGGGKILLLSLLSHALPEQVILIVDARMDLPSNLAPNIQIKTISPTIIARLCGEYWLSKNTQENDTILCFGNLPPLFRLKGTTKLFLQNRYLIDDVNLKGFNWRSKIRLNIEKLWFRFTNKNVDTIIVQTPSMKKLLSSKVSPEKSILTLPFSSENQDSTNTPNDHYLLDKEESHFVYIASGEPHKNHKTLFEAWFNLAADGIFPTLHTTLQTKEFDKIISKLQHQYSNLKPNFKNWENLDHKEVHTLYQTSTALIYPSKLESFGLPLIEAKNCGLPILASELDYVRDIVTPEETFDPNSSVSIARAVKRFMEEGEQPITILKPTEFLKKIMDETNQNEHPHI